MFLLYLASEHDVGHSKPIIAEHLKTIGLQIDDVEQEYDADDDD